MASSSTGEFESSSSQDDSGFIQSSTPCKSTGLSDEFGELCSYEEMEGIDREQLGDKPMNEENALLGVAVNVESSKMTKSRRKLSIVKSKNRKRRSLSATKVRFYLHIIFMCYYNN